MNTKEQFAKKLNPYFLGLYLLTSAVLLVYFLVQKNWYQFGLAAASFPLIFLPQIFYRVCGLKEISSLTLLSRAFIFIAFHIGMAARAYALVPGYDKFAHTLSGTFFAFVGLVIFYFFKSNHHIEKSDNALAVSFSFFFSMSVAGIWEIYEFSISHLLGTDPQGVVLTGVSDTMWDMIVCLIGTVIMCVIAYLYYKKNRTGFFMSALETYVGGNFE